MVNEIPERPDDNPWYLLATLYGQPSHLCHDLADKNRRAWNRYMAAEIGDELRSNLTKTGQYTADELTPFSPEELSAIQLDFALRSGTSANIPEIPETIDFSNIVFDKPFFAERFVFPKSITFHSATFSDFAHFSSATFAGADFSSATFSRYANFGIATFARDARFDGATFAGPASFSSATFSGTADFRSATFSYVNSMPKPPLADANFDRAKFSGTAYFSSATFSGTANFRSAKFLACQTLPWYNIADFGRATFSGPADFSSATFSGTANFRFATFSDLADFSSRATFAGLADFSKATFSGLAHFQMATFGQVTRYVDAKMESQTSFDDATFSQPPQFYGAKLHEGTRWHGAKWPEPPRDTATARDYVDAYERLKLEMDRLKKHEDELKFFASELQCRRVILGFWKGLPIAAYGFLCDYGRSYFRPLSFLMATVFLGTFFSVAHFVGYWTPGISDTGHTWQAIGLSFANTFGVFGINRDLIGPGVLQYLPGWLKVVSTFQTVFGIGLLLLFGLGIRNRFRMR